MKRPAQASSVIDSAIWAVASVVRNRWAERAPDGWPAWPLSVETRSGRVLCSAGNSPNRMPVPIVRAPAKSSTFMSTAEGIVAAASSGSTEAMKSIVQRATSRPAAPPSTASRHDSTSSCEMSCSRLAPSDSRIAISLARAAARASSRLAMFAHAMISTSAVTPSRSSSGVRASPCTELWPRQPSSNSTPLALNRAIV